MQKNCILLSKYVKTLFIASTTITRSIQTKEKRANEKQSTCVVNEILVESRGAIHLHLLFGHRRLVLVDFHGIKLLPLMMMLL